MIFSYLDKNVEIRQFESPYFDKYVEIRKFEIHYFNNSRGRALTQLQVTRRSRRASKKPTAGTRAITNRARPASGSTTSYWPWPKRARRRRSKPCLFQAR